jgi:Fur family transcriptional regulator, peroxide stress response regulator
MNPSAVSDEFRRALERAGWRCTRQRAAVYDYLRSVDCHPTADEVFHAVQGRIPHIGLGTVYKALDALADAGLVVKIPDPAGRARFDARTEPHYHFRCLRTGRLLDLPAEALPDLLDRLRRDGFRVTACRLEVLGFTPGDDAPPPPGGGPT